MKLLGHNAHEKAELAGRTECNLQDVVASFGDLGVVMKELMEDVAETDEIPFAHVRG